MPGSSSPRSLHRPTIYGQPHDADVSRRAMLCGVLAPNLHITELDAADNLLTGVTLAGVAIAPNGPQKTTRASLKVKQAH